MVSQTTQMLPLWRLLLSTPPIEPIPSGNRLVGRSITGRHDANLNWKNVLDTYSENVYLSYRRAEVQEKLSPIVALALLTDASNVNLHVPFTLPRGFEVFFFYFFLFVCLFVCLLVCLFVSFLYILPFFLPFLFFILDNCAFFFFPPSFPSPFQIIRYSHCRKGASLSGTRDKLYLAVLRLDQVREEFFTS